MENIERRSFMWGLLLIMGSLGAVSTSAQPATVTLPQVTIEAKHTFYVTDPGPGAPMRVRSSNLAVATATIYGTDQVQIVAVWPGSTDVEFFDSTSRVRYTKRVFVEASNPTGGGGQGYNPRLTQLDQIVMLVKHYQNVT